MLDLAVKRSGPDLIEGWAIPYGTDIDGERFTPKTNLALDWFGKSGRPLLYDHGLDGAHTTVPIGVQTDYETRAEGIWATAQLSMAAKYRKAVAHLIDQGAVGFSSGTMAHLGSKNARNEITSWPWVELSLTPVPAHPATMVHHVKSAALLEHLAGDDTQLSIAAVKAIAAGLNSESANPDPDSLDDKAGRVSAAIDDFREHVRSSAEMRIKAGRVLSGANRERISKALASRAAVLEAYADLEALLTETDPETAQKAANAIQREFLAFQAIEARLLGVEVPSMT